MIDASDLKLVAVLARTRTAAAAASELKTHPATVYRRLKNLELEIGGPLFEKVSGQYRSTPLGSELIAAHQRVEDALTQVQRRIAGGDQSLVGRLVITTADSLVPVVSRLIVAFREAHPQITFDLIVSNGFADMARYEAEIAIRPTRTPPETLVGRQAGAFDFGVYARAGVADDAWVTLDESLAAIPSSRWLHNKIGSGGGILRVNSMWAAAEAVAAGAGRAVLPDYLAKAHALQQIGEPVRELQSQVWLLIHPDLRHVRRVRAFLDFGCRFFKSEL